MIVLDTNVLTEVLKPAPSAAVVEWIVSQQPLEIYTTTITLAEILNGIEALPAGKRRGQLSAAVERIFAEQFSGRILPFNESAPRMYARIVAERSAAGHPISQFDGMIAAIARSQHGGVATRNASDFRRCGIQVINPWTDKR